MFRQHAVADPNVEILEDFRRWPGWPIRWIADPGQMHDGNSMSAVKNAEENIVAVLTTSQRSKCQAEQGMSECEFAD